MADELRPDRWQALVNDERARRAFAEKELAAVRRKLAEAKRGGRRRRRRDREEAPAPADAGTAKFPPPFYPAIRAVVGGVPAWATAMCDTISFTSSDEASLAGADLVIVGGADVPAGLEAWLGWEARQPLVAVEPTGALAHTLAGGDPVDVLVGEASVPAKSTVPLPAPSPEPWPEHASMSASDVAGWLDAYRRARPRAWAADTLRAAGLDVPDLTAGVTAVVVTKRPGQLAHVAEVVCGFGDSLTAVSIGTHDFEMSREERHRFPESTRAVALPGDWPLGKCMNHLMAEVATPLWAKIDDDDFYGPRYLEEAVATLDLTGADLVGKHTHYLYDADADETYLMESGNEHYSNGYVMGPTFVGRRRTWEVVPFAHRFARIDSTFVRGVKAAGLDICAASRFEFALGRGGDSHTWHVERSRYTAKGRKVGDGLRLDDIFLPA